MEILTDELDAARETLEQTLMRFGLGGTIAEWVSIHAAIDAYAGVVMAARDSASPNSEEADRG